MSDTEVLPAKRVRKSTAKAEQAAASVEASKMSDSEDEIFLPTDSEDEVLLPINYESLPTKPSKKSALKAKKQPKKPQADGEAGPSRPKTKSKPKVAEPCKTCGRSPKKKARAGAATKKVKVVKDTTCVKACRKGPKSGCLTRQNGRGKSAGNLSCKEVDRRLKALGVDAAKASLCVKAAIMKGLIKITGEDKEELNKVSFLQFILEDSCAILISFKIVVVFNTTSPDIKQSCIENYHVFERNKDRATVFLK